MLKRIKVAVDPILRSLTDDYLYAAYTLDESEYIGTIEDIDTLCKIGYQKPPTVLGIQLEAAKLHPETEQVHEHSFRKVADNERWQYHVHLWPTESGGYDVYSHKEYRPDFGRIGSETNSERFERLDEHLNPTWGETYLLGESGDELESLVSP